LQGENGMLTFWLYIFWASKLYELLDTVILVLRKARTHPPHTHHADTTHPPHTLTHPHTHRCTPLTPCSPQSPLRFLHVYHHWITNLLMFWCLYFALPMTWLAGVLNAAVHVPMYLYYWLAIAGVRGLWWKVYITQMQIVQFLLVIAGQVTAFVWHYTGGHCHGFDHWLHPNAVGLAIVFSYLALFIVFYIESYTRGKTDQNQKKTQ
jgi:hypothetical protein